MPRLRHYCPSCREGIFSGECTGESGIYRSGGIPDLCERCFIIEDAVIDNAGTNDLPEVLADYIKNYRECNG